MSYHYLQPATITELIALRKQYGPGSVLIAGGTDVMVKINGGRLKPDALISLNRVRNLERGIRLSATGITVGALATLTYIGANKTVRKHFPALRLAADAVGSLQIRNRATLAGNICNASPAADTATPLLVYDAVVNITNGTRTRKVPAGSFFLAPGKTVLQKDEIVRSVFLPFRKNKTKSSFARISRREGVDLAIVGIAGQVDADGTVRLALGAVGPVPYRAAETEAHLSRNPSGTVGADTVTELLLNEARPISDVRASQEYRHAMVKALAVRVLGECGYTVR